MKHNLCWSGYEKFLICNISIFLFRLFLKDFLQCLIKGAGTEDNSSIIISKERAAPALTTPAGVLFFNLFAASLPFFHLFSVACFGFSAAVIYSSVGQQSQQPAGGFRGCRENLLRDFRHWNQSVVILYISEREDRYRDDVGSTEEIRSGAVTALHQRFSSLQNGRLQMLSSPPGAVFHNRLPE